MQSFKYTIIIGIIICSQSFLFSMNYEQEVIQAIETCQLQKLETLTPAHITQNVIRYTDTALQNQQCAPDILRALSKIMGNKQKFAYAHNSQSPSDHLLLKCSNNSDAIQWMLEEE